MESINTTDAHPNSNQERLFALDEENNKCVDCHKEPVVYLSINNGVTLCEECSSNHSSVFGSAISYLRKIDAELDYYLFNFYVFGGNTKFITCLQLFSIDNSLEIQKKYKTYGADYYRRNLKAKVKGLKPINNIDFSKGAQIREATHDDDDYPEFHNYQLQIKENKGTGSEGATGKTGMNKIMGFFGKISSKVSDFNIKEKFNAGKTKTFEGIAKFGQYVASTTEPTKNKIKAGASTFLFKCSECFP